MGNFIKILCISAILLTIGGIIYILFRTPIIAFTQLNLNYERQIVFDVRNPFFYFLIFCLPDALWYMSLLLSQLLFVNKKGFVSRLLIYFAVASPFLLEIMQYFGFISGTFDWCDILTYCFTLILFLCLKKHFLRLLCK